jgi:hypothetical protein
MGISMAKKYWLVIFSGKTWKEFEKSGSFTYPLERTFLHEKTL